MGVLKRGNSKFWYIQFQLNGRTFIKSSKSTDRRIAELMEADWRKQMLQQQVLGIKERISLGDSLDLFKQAKRDLASYPDIARHARFLVTELQHVRFLDELTSSDLERLRLNRQRSGFSAQTVKHTIGVIRGAIKYAKRMGYQIPEVEYPTISVSKGKLRYLTFEEEKRLLLAVDPRRPVKGMPPYEQRPAETRREMQDLFDFLVLLLDTGARHSELATLEWGRVDLSQRTISLWRPKVKNESVLFMTDRAFEVLSRRHGERATAFVFTNRSGQARGYIPSTLRRAFLRADLPDCSAHTLRHTHATRLIQNGLSLYEVKEILGHADIKTTMRYAHIEQRSVSIKAKEVIDRLNKENQRPNLRAVK